MDETTNKREPWPTHLFACCSGGKSLCLWGFLCPLCLHFQFCLYSDDQHHRSSLNPESQLKRYPPFSCRGFDLLTSEDLYCGLICFYGCVSGLERHDEKMSNFEYYCSSQPCCFTCRSRFHRTVPISVEDCLIGYFCCCCSIIQMVMANEELFRMRSKVEGDFNIKSAR